jgi:hypothetical protein
MNTYFKTLFQILILTSLLSCTTSKKETTTEKKPSIAEAISILPNATIEETIAHYYKLKEEQPSVYNFDDENELNGLGYKYLGNKEVKSAIEIFKLLVSEFPEASNPYDSLAEAYYIDGNKEQAVVNYEKSLALNEQNINAEEWINKIKYAEYDNTRFSKIYTVDKYTNDLSELARRLTEVNPNAYKFISKEDFWELVNSKKALLTNSTTFSEFIWHCSEVIASIDCSHTSMGYFNQERNMLPVSLRFPLKLKLVDERLYVADPLINKDKVALKDEIVSINDIPFDSIKKEMYKHISSQGSIESYKKNFFNVHSTSIIPYTLGFPKSYKITLKGARTIELKQLETYDSNYKGLPDYLCAEPLCVKHLSESKTAIMTIRDFAYYGSRFPEYKKFIDSSFKEFEKKNIQNLIIDVRGNGGGPSSAGILLLRYLAKEPFAYFSSSQFNEKLDEVAPFNNAFKGNLYFTIDGNGGSTTGHFMSLVKHLNLATMVGEELGSNQFCTGGQKMLRLPNTGIIYSVARNTYVTSAIELPIDRGIMPDYFVSQSIDDDINNIDAVMNFTLNLVDKNSKFKVLDD